MVTRTLACILPAVIVTFSTPAGAGQSLAGVDGCAILASVVYAEVTGAWLGRPPARYGEATLSGKDDISHCSRTAQTATSAFTAALRNSGIHITWGLHGGHIVDYCPGYFLSHCYPSGDPAMPPLSATERSFVMRAWAAVDDSVTSQLSHYPGGDASRFRGRELGRSIRLFFDANHRPDRPAR